MRKIALEDRIKRNPSRSVSITVLSVSFFGALSFLMVQIVSAREPLTTARDVFESQSEARLKSRLNMPDVDMKTAIEQRKKLLTTELSVHATSEQGTVIDTWKIRLRDKPSWIVFRKGSDGVMQTEVSEERILASLESDAFPSLPVPRSCTVLSTWKDSFDVTRAQTDCIAKSGYLIDRPSLAARVKRGIESGEKEMLFTAALVHPTIEDPDYAPRGTLTLLATGHSNFKGSGEGRKTNVRKALTERIHNVLIPDGAVFSFNDALGNSISLRNGWKEALTIFEGVNLRPAPGGGLCQASTTLFRAALRAGLPIVEQKNHSLYVVYYEAHGVGQDATVFPGKQDFRFKNDTGGPILIQAYNENDEAYVRIFGLDDKRRVTLSGPYFASTRPKEIADAGKKIRTNEVVWIRSVEREVSSTAMEIFTSKYNAIPKSLPKKFTASLEETRKGPLHAAAPQANAPQAID